MKFILMLSIPDTLFQTSYVTVFFRFDKEIMISILDGISMDDFYSYVGHQQQDFIQT